MNQELRLHGRINEAIEYFATAAGYRNAHQYFFEETQQELRFFSPGNELRLGPEKLLQAGSGGTFCEYMFGVEQPLSDLTKDGIHNRLILLGAGYDIHGSFRFDEHSRFEQSYETIFQQGHAVHNFFFFIDGFEEPTISMRQENILRRLGKPLKRLKTINQLDDSQLAESICSLLPDHCSIVLIRLTDTRNRIYREEFQQRYYSRRKLTESDHAELKNLAEKLRLDPYMQERISIDAMYRHRENYGIIDEYKQVLVESYRNKKITRKQHARLSRLKALALRQDIPLDLLSALDHQLQPEIDQIASEPEHTAVTRDILQDLLFQRGVSNHDMVQMLFAKKAARFHHDSSFEQLLLESGKLFDERIREGAPTSLLEDFSNIITYFDRYDSTSTQISRLAFMDNFHIGREWLSSLLYNRQQFNKLGKGLFTELFFDDIIISKYLNRFGRRKLDRLAEGLELVAAGTLPLERLCADLTMIEQEERLYQFLINGIKDRIRQRYYRYDTREEQLRIFDELQNELSTAGSIEGHLDPDLFQNALVDVKKEILYVSHILPDIVARQDPSLREDFIINSGLDYFHIEELEREYFNLNNLDPDDLNRLRAE